MKTRVSISAKILLLAFLNVLLLGLVFVAFVRLQYRFDLSSLLLSPGRDRILARSWEIALRLQDTDRADWDRLLASYTAVTHAAACLFDNQGTQLAGPATHLPQQVLEVIRRDQPPLFAPPGLGPGVANRKPPPPGPPQLPPVPVFVITTRNPMRYWVGASIRIRGGPMARPLSGTLVWAASSFWTNPFFFDYKPWLAVVSAVILVSAVCWLPLIRGLTHSISQLTAATSSIAEGKLETRVSLDRRDELGQLSEAINGMAGRLSGFVHGQRRFLSDVAHELCTPLSRIQVSMGILDQRAREDQKEYVKGLQEEVEHMSGLVNELLLFSRIQISAAAVCLTKVNVADTVVRVLERESSERASIQTHIDRQTEVMAQPDYLFRSLANVVRNAIRYAGDCGPIEISAEEKNGVVSISIADNGPGIPEAELEEVFKPFYRPEFARQRETGGVGLGLAIVRSCVEACGGTVTCRNRLPKGLTVEIRLRIAHA